MKSERNRRAQQVFCNRAGDETGGKDVENGSGGAEEKCGSDYKLPWQETRAVSMEGRT